MAEDQRPPGRDDRAARLAAAMRANLGRRKRPQRAREPEPQPRGEAGEPVEPG